MTKIHLIIGLPGSGKTHYAKTVLGHLPLADDIIDINQLPKEGDFVVTDVNFCDDRILKLAKTMLFKLYPGAKIETVYFENNSEKARANVFRRNDGRNVEGTIRRFMEIYNPPENALKIYQDNKERN